MLASMSGSAMMSADPCTEASSAPTVVTRQRRSFVPRLRDRTSRNAPLPDAGIKTRGWFSS